MTNGLSSVLNELYFALMAINRIDYCGVDKNEQEVLNYWKKEYEIDKIVAEIGHAYLDTIVIIDTTQYKTAVIYQPEEYRFGSKIDGVYSVQYKSCEFYNSSAKGTGSVNYILIQPNPSNSHIEINFSSEINVDDIRQLVISNMYGRDVVRMNISQETFGNGIILNVSEWLPGTYTVSAHSTGNGIYRERLIVQ